MKRLLVLSLFAAFAFGAQAATQDEGGRFPTPEEWRAQVSDKFDLTALRAFLAASIEAQKKIDGVDLHAIPMGKSFKFDKRTQLARCGKWIFTWSGGDYDGFGIYAIYEKGKQVEFECTREKRDTFKVVRSYRMDLIMVVPAAENPKGK